MYREGKSKPSHSRVSFSHSTNPNISLSLCENVGLPTSGNSNQHPHPPARQNPPPIQMHLQVMALSPQLPRFHLRPTPNHRFQTPPPPPPRLLPHGPHPEVQGALLPPLRRRQFHLPPRPSMPLQHPPCKLLPCRRILQRCNLPLRRPPRLHLHRYPLEPRHSKVFRKLISIESLFVVI